MTCKRQLPTGREDAHAVVGCWIGGRQKEGRLGQIGPPGQGLHLVRCHPSGLTDHCHGVPAQRHFSEDVDLTNARAHAGPPMRKIAQAGRFG